MNYYVDFDETLVQSTKAVLSILNKKYGTNFKPTDVKKWDYSDCFPNMNIEYIEKIFESDEFFENLEFIEGAKEWLENHLEDVTIITKGSLKNIIQKVTFFEKQNINIKSFIGLSLDKSKRHIDMTNNVFIDDVSENLNESNATYKILFRNIPNVDWNKDWKGKVITKWEQMN